MDSLVLELQRDALDRSIHITDLLRKALLVSKKLKIKDIEEWINDELNGYKENSIPEYRIIHGQLKALNPYRGWVPVMVNQEWEEMICQQRVFLSVSQIENLVAESEGGNFIYKFTADMAQALTELVGQNFEYALHVPIHHLVRILDTTKTKILEFALDLESKGILGEGMTFTKDEQQLAQSVTYNTINIERMENSQIQQAAEKSEQLR